MPPVDIQAAQMQQAYQRVELEQTMQQVMQMLQQINAQYRSLQVAVFGQRDERGNLVGTKDEKGNFIPHNPGLMYRTFIAERMCDMLIGKTAITAEETEAYQKLWTEKMEQNKRDQAAAIEAQKDLGREA